MHRSSILRCAPTVALVILLLAPVPASGAGVGPVPTAPRSATSLTANATAQDQGGHWNCAQGAETFALFSHVGGGLAPYRYAWNFGDGSPPSSAEDPVHTYTTPQSFTVTLVVVDSGNASARASVLLNWGIPLYCSGPTTNWGGVLLYGALIVGIAGGGFLVFRARRRSPPLPPWP